MTKEDVNSKISELEKEIEELEEEKQYTMNWDKIEDLDDQILNTKDSIKKLKAYV